MRMGIKALAGLGVVRTISFVVVLSAFLGGAYYILHRVFTYLTTVELIGMALIDRTLEMGFFVFFTMLLFSNIITSFSTFYFNRELDFLFALPVRPTSVYLAKLFENAVYASWATMVLGLPLVCAYGVVKHATPLYYPVALVSLLAYLVIPSAMASIMLFVLLSVFPRLKPRNVVLTALALIVALTYFYVKLANPGVFKILETESEQELLAVAANLATVGGTYVPSTWLSIILRGSVRLSGFRLDYLALLFFFTASCVICAYFVAQGLYQRSWLAIGEHGGVEGRKVLSLLGRPPGGQNRALLFKDIMVFLREPTQWVQLSIFFILLVIYVLSLRRTPLYFTFTVWRTIVSFANFAYISFVLSTLGVRFMYPTISLEQRGILLLASAPVSFRRVVTVKYLFNVVWGLIVFEGLLLLSNLFIRTDQSFRLVTPLAGLLVAASLVSINLGLGSRFPQFNEDNPSRIASGSGGIIAALSSIAYVGVSIVILAPAAYNHLAHRYLGRPDNPYLTLFSLLAFAVLSITVTVALFRLAQRGLEHRNY